MDDIQELRETVNPVFNTAKSCVQLNAAAGDADAQRLLDLMGFEPFGSDAANRRVPPEMAEQVRRLAPAYMVLTEARYQMVNGLIESRGGCEVVDLPCGYTSRGVRMHRQKRSYFGLDLPAVIDVIGPATRSVIGEDDEAIRYRAVDATNHDSLAEAVSAATGELLVVTEGLLMYFTQQELEEVFSNIRRLLVRHGGSWVIVDRTFTRASGRIAEAALGGDPRLYGLYQAITARAAGTTADVTLEDNVMFAEDDEAAKAFVRRMGFTPEEVVAYDYLPEVLGSLRSHPECNRDVREVFRDVRLWELKVADKGTSDERRGKTFSAHAEVRGRVLHVSVTGRLDTLSAPELLDLFRGQDAGTFDDIVVDLADLEYISSAGIRVLVIMYKAVAATGRLQVVNTCETVSSAIDMTGLGDLLLA